MRVDIYVDGSYTRADPTITRGGYVILLNNQPVVLRHVSTRERQFVDMWNVGGELYACMCGLLDIERLNLDLAVITVHHDFEGIASYANPKAKLKKPGTILYRQVIASVLKENPTFKLGFNKVKAHSGNKYNDIADNMAGNRVCYIPAHLSGLILPPIT